MVRPRVNPTQWPLAPTVHSADDVPTTSQSSQPVPVQGYVTGTAPVNQTHQPKVEPKAAVSAPKQVKFNCLPV